MPANVAAGGYWPAALAATTPLVRAPFLAVDAGVHSTPSNLLTCCGRARGAGRLRPAVQCGCGSGQCPGRRAVATPQRVYQPFSRDVDVLRCRGEQWCTCGAAFGGGQGTGLRETRRGFARESSPDEDALHGASAREAARPEGVRGLQAEPEVRAHGDGARGRAGGARDRAHRRGSGHPLRVSAPVVQEMRRRVPVRLLLEARHRVSVRFIGAKEARTQERCVKS